MLLRESSVKSLKIKCNCS